jgi:hypothetical protein
VGREGGCWEQERGGEDIYAEGEVEGGESAVEVHEGCWYPVGVFTFLLVLLVGSVACGSWHGVVEQSLLAGWLRVLERIGKRKTKACHCWLAWLGSGFGSMMHGRVEIPSFV